MSLATILITEPDMLTLADLLERERRWPMMERDHLRAFARQLAGAAVVRDHEIPRDVITLHSRVRVRDLDTGNDATYLLVMPAHSSAAAGAVSVLSPVGAALLGCSQGDEVEFRRPGGMRRLRIEQVVFQPEAAERRSARRDGSDAENSARQQPDKRVTSLLPLAA
jgi:regulator of nucleoside diphosphate kinase